MNRFAVFTLPFFLVLFASCAPELTLQARGDNGADIGITTTFAPDDELKSLLGSLGFSLPEMGSSNFISSQDLKAFLKDAGFQNTTATVSKEGNIAATGSCTNLSQLPLAQFNLITRTPNSLTLTLGASQWKKIYESSSEETRGYLDLFMIPALSDEKMSLSEYRELLASVYGPSIASEIVDSKLVIFLVTPDGKKKTKISTTLGALLARTEEKSWSVTW